jgi:hypothetical protein
VIHDVNILHGPSAGAVIEQVPGSHALIVAKVHILMVQAPREVQADQPGPGDENALTL